MSTEKPNLRDVLTFYGVEVTRTGRNVQILCPVHDESRPSCSYNEADGLLNCMSCGFGGDVWSLIIKKEGLDGFAAAVEFAATTFGFSSGGVSQPARRRGPGLSRKPGTGFSPRYRNTPPRTRPLSSS